MTRRLGTILSAVVVSMLLASTEADADQKRPAGSMTKGDSAEMACTTA
jgi:hypothetical protein